MFPLRRLRLDSGSVFTRLATELLGSHIFNVKVDTHAVSGRHMFVSVSPEECSTSGFDWEMTSCIWGNVWFGSANSFCGSHGGLLRAICTRCSHLERGHQFSTQSLAVTCSVYLVPEENELEFSGDDFRTIFYFSSSCSMRQRVHVRASEYGGFPDGVAHFLREDGLCILRSTRRLHGIRAWTSTFATWIFFGPVPPVPERGNPVYRCGVGGSPCR